MLEGRAAARERMNHVQDALEDANRMLETQPTNPRVTIVGDPINYRDIFVWDICSRSKMTSNSQWIATQKDSLNAYRPVRRSEYETLEMTCLFLGTR